MHVGEKLLNFIYKPDCVSCKKAGKWMCDCCKNRFVRALPECYVCKKLNNAYKTHARCLNWKNPFSDVFVIWMYNDLAKKLLGTYKYKGAYNLQSTFSESMNGEYCLDSLSKSFSSKGTTQGQDTLFTSVPLHTRRYNERGFNQSELIAKQLAKEYKIPYSSDVVTRRQNNTHQAQVSYTGRSANVKNIFAISNQIDRAFIQSTFKRIIVFDDVITTGATLNEVGMTIRKAFPDIALSAICLFRGKGRKKC